MARPYRPIGMIEVATHEDATGVPWDTPTNRIVLPWGESVTVHFDRAREYRVAWDGEQWVLYERT